MRIMLAVFVVVLAFSISVYGQSPQTPTSKAKAQEQQQPSDVIYDNIPVERVVFKRPTLMMQRAQEMAEDYLKKEKIDISPYFLKEARLLFANPEHSNRGQYWLFVWDKELGVWGDEVKIGVWMNGESFLIPSL